MRACVRLPFFLDSWRRIGNYWFIPQITDFEPYDYWFSVLEVGISVENATCMSHAEGMIFSNWKLDCWSNAETRDGGGAAELSRRLWRHEYSSFIFSSFCIKYSFSVSAGQYFTRTRLSQRMRDLTGLHDECFAYNWDVTFTWKTKTYYLPEKCFRNTGMFILSCTSIKCYYPFYLEWELLPLIKGKFNLDSKLL